VAWFHLIKGLADYRDGQFAAAVEGAEKGLAGGALASKDVAAHAVLAMGQHRAGQADKAAASLARASQLLETMPKAGDDLADDWHGWLFCHILYREAESVLKQPPGAPPAPQEKPGS
jgi:hypothetical protein